MNFFNNDAAIFIPDNTDKHMALSRTTDLCIAAHQDDIEIMAYGSIANCYGNHTRHFTGIVVTDGRGSPRSGVYANYSDEDMKNIRAIEQKNAALVGRYSVQVMLSYRSSEIKKPMNRDLIEDIKSLIQACTPEVLYTHNLADKQDTHIGVVLHVIHALRELPTQQRPKKVISMEVWRSLDWLCDEDKYIEDTSAYPNISAALLGVFDSQVSGGKRYDMGAIGRRLANATFSATHAVDEYESASYGLDITDLINSNTSPTEFISRYIDKFKEDVVRRLATVEGGEI